MVLDIKSLVKKYNMEVAGIIHAGGHFGQEIKIYKQIFPKCKIQIFEPHPNSYKQLISNITDDTINAHNVALGSNNMISTLYTETANAGQSNSLLVPKGHITQYPQIPFNGTISVPVHILDDYMFGAEYDFLVMDVQGYELEILKGATKTLLNMKYIMTEVNREELYEDCSKVEELDTFLHVFGFSRVETDWCGGTWGDAFYVKQ